jgi:hypothetical protein
MLELSEEADKACDGGAMLSPDEMQVLQVQVGRRQVQLRYRLVAALVMKPSHYATCMLDQENGHWLHFDGMLQGEGREGPTGRGKIITAPKHANDVGGKFWSMVLYERVASLDA